MKTWLAVGTLLLAALLLGFWQLGQNRALERELAARHTQVAGLLTAAGDAARREFTLNQALERLGSELAIARGQLDAASAELAEAEERVNPDYAAMRRRIRAELERELAYAARRDEYRSQADLVRAWVALDPLEASRLRAVQDQYGDFLRALDVNDSRLDQIIRSLQDLQAEQNEERMAIVARMQSGAAPPDDMAGRLLEMVSPEAQREALSTLLSDEELAVFDDWQASREMSIFVSGMEGAVPMPFGAGAGWVGGWAEGLAEELAVGSPEGPTAVVIQARSAEADGEVSELDVTVEAFAPQQAVTGSPGNGATMVIRSRGNGADGDGSERDVIVRGLAPQQVLIGSPADPANMLIRTHGSGAAGTVSELDVIVETPAPQEPASDP